MNQTHTLSARRPGRLAGGRFSDPGPESRGGRRPIYPTIPDPDNLIGKWVAMSRRLLRTVGPALSREAIGNVARFIGLVDRKGVWPPPTLGGGRWGKFAREALSLSAMRSELIIACRSQFAPAHVLTFIELAEETVDAEELS